MSAPAVKPLFSPAISSQTMPPCAAPLQAGPPQSRACGTRALPQSTASTLTRSTRRSPGSYEWLGARRLACLKGKSLPAQPEKTAKGCVYVQRRGGCMYSEGMYTVYRQRGSVCMYTQLKLLHACWAASSIVFPTMAGSTRSSSGRARSRVPHLTHKA